MNSEDYCSYELSVKLKEKGFDWEVYRIYSQGLGECDWYEAVLDNYNFDIGYISAPTLSQAQKMAERQS